MQDFETLRQPPLRELAMSRKKEEEERGEKNAVYSGQLRTPLGPMYLPTFGYWTFY